MKKLGGFFQSGVIVVVDPVYMSGPVEYKVEAEDKDLNSRELTPARTVISTPDDPYNPFRKFDPFNSTLNEEDQNLKFHGKEDEGFGVAIQTGRMSGQYTIERIEDSAGKLLELRIVFKD